jgi:esterase/lipase superfamily enzyme
LVVLAAATLLLPLLAGAQADIGQATGLQQAFQRFEVARAGNDPGAAVEAGRQALQQADAAGPVDARTRADLLRSLAEVLVRSGNDAEALVDYQRALELRGAEMGADHPDLVPLLDAIADLQVRARRYAAAIAALQRALGIELAAYSQRHPAVAATYQRLRNANEVAGNSAEVERIDRQLALISAAPRAIVNPPVPGPSAVPSASPDPGERYRQQQGFATVRVFYGTNRAPTGLGTPAEFYGAQRGDLQLGYLDVTVPETHRQGELETQSRWSVYTLFADKATLKRRYVLLDSVTPLAHNTWLQALQGQVRSAPSRDVFLFVHGFNSTFEDAARRTAQLAYDLDFDGTPLMYSWPSQASTSAYTVDEAAVNVSGRRLAELLEDLVARSGAERIHLIAHSMGSRALIEALQIWMTNHEAKPRRKAFGQIVFTAPDVDSDYFTDVIDPLGQTAERVTLYASDKDLALKTSEAVHGAPRAGMAGTGIITRPGLDTIDMSAVEADVLGHNYFAADAGAIYDLFRLLWRGDPPPQRCGMSVRTGAPRANLWLFDVNHCRGQDLLEAGVLVKRFGDRARTRVLDRIAVLTDPDQKQEWSRILTRLDGLLNNRRPP